eukprot:CAMPEP_0115484036 /NCGR_PEP_ID=MMETSP0271-20121206/59169_1 /TAXON_ID=71861 /ORGANISM="Scrippsiella trochoidea, Strain CCMP3099" /LENGTH=193 /DNA_ID=CAMNT_0002911915 /DNA_START=57 /DNA_END=638 /DNA_ORIENTATION=+
MAEEQLKVGDQYVARQDLLRADEAFAEAVEMLEVPQSRGRPTTRSGEPVEDKLLADCLRSRAQCTLDMAEGKGVLPDGTPFKAQFAIREHFAEFQRQAINQAEEFAEKACLVWADEKTLTCLGVARMLIAEEKAEGPRAFLLSEEAVQDMQDAGRCFMKSIRACKTEVAEGKLREVKDWLAEKGVDYLFPQYV